jgi:integrase
MTKQKRRGHGEGSIYRRKDGRWVAEITLEDGSRKPLYGKTRKEVADKLTTALQEQKQGILATGPQQKLKDYLEHWLENVHKPTVRLSTYQRYRTTLDRHILPELGHIPLQKLTPQHVQKFYASKLQEGLSPNTIRLIHGTLHKALKNAVRWNLVPRNICDAVSPPKRTTRREMHVLTIEQAQQLLETAIGHRLEALLTVAVATGMRRGELLALRWQDINFETSSLYICRSVSRLTGHGFVESEPKTAASRRKITLPQFALEALRVHRTRQLEARLKAGERWEDRDLVFPNIWGGFLSTNRLFSSFIALLKDAGLPHVRFHDLRHSAATILLVMGAHPKVVQELLGHSRIAMTLDIYSHVLPSMQEEIMDKLNDLFQ